MVLTHLSLTHFRNYRTLEIDFSGDLTLLQGENAQGKTNLLEAIYFLATSRPVHARQDREVVGWAATEEPIPYSRVAGTVQLNGPERRPLNLEILLTSRGDGVSYKKQVRINGVNKRNMDLIGQLRAVLFLPEDIALVADGPGVRRRYLDIALCQIDQHYCRTLSAYQKVVTQRNGLLKNLREQAAAPQAASTVAQLGFWDEQLVRHGSIVMARRHNFISELAQIAQQRHLDLSDEREELALQFVPSFNPASMTEQTYLRLKEGQYIAGGEIADQVDAAAIAEAYTAHLDRRRPRIGSRKHPLWPPPRRFAPFCQHP